MNRKLIALVLCLALVLSLASGCGSSGSSSTKPSSDSDALNYTESIDNYTLDASTYLDYSNGIDEGVYAWILSDDGTYYVLASVDEDGEPITAQSSSGSGMKGGGRNFSGEEGEDQTIDADKPDRSGNTDGTKGGSSSENSGVEAADAEDGVSAVTLDDESSSNDSENLPDGDIPEDESVADGDLPDGELPEDVSGADGDLPDGDLPEDVSGADGDLPDGDLPEDADISDSEGSDISAVSGLGGSTYQGVYINANITNTEYQTMLIYVPAEYFTTDDDGNVTGIDYDASVGNYTAETAPIVFQNECSGWRSSSPVSCDTSYIEEGMIYVACGARSRDAEDEDGNISGKSPTQVVDLKSGVIELRANEDIIPGDKDRIISVGSSGGGQMSSILGASGNMTEYYEYMYESGVLGVTVSDDGTYESVYDDSIYAAQCYCPIADIENADMAYAWWWYDLADEGYTSYGGTEFSEFKLRLQELLAEEFVDYINSLGLTDEDGNELTLTGLREGTYYDAVLQNISDALNAMIEADGVDPESDYEDYDSWLVKNDDGTYSVTDLAGFMIGTGLADSREKDITGFDAFDLSGESDAFGTSEDEAVHFSASVASVLQDNYDELSELDGFDDVDVDGYIEEALTGDTAEAISDQTDLMNATEIMLGSSDLAAVDPAEYWRIRSGTADPHTSFSIGYNLSLAAEYFGSDADYSLVWDMGHGSEEGSSTGTFIDWIKEICG